MGSTQPGTNLGTFVQRIGSLKTVPPKILRMVPLGLLHMLFSLNSIKIKNDDCYETYKNAAKKPSLTEHFVKTKEGIILA